MIAAATVPLLAVLGVGNLYRSDDAVGPMVAARLSRAFAGDRRVLIADLDGEPVRLMQTWGDCQHVILVDAVRSGSPAGTVHQYGIDDLTDGAARSVALAGGHALGLSDAIALARTLNRLPARLEVVTVEGASFELGQGLSDPVACACDRIVEELSGRIERLS